MLGILATGVPHPVPHGNEWDLTPLVAMVAALAITRIVLGRLTPRGGTAAIVAALLWEPLADTAGPSGAGLLALATVAVTAALHGSVQPD